MALLFVDSFDHYQTTEILDKWTNAGAAGPGVIVPGAGRCNSQAIQLGAGAFLVKGLSFGSTTGILGFALDVTTQVFNSSKIAYFMNPTGSGIQMHLSRNLDGSLTVFRADAAPVALVTTAPDVTREGNYYFIEWLATIDNAAGASQVRVNGVLVASVAGVDTRSDSVLNDVLSGVAIGGAASYVSFVDDVYVVDSTGSAPWNSFLGDVKVEYLRPDGPGAHQDWSAVGAATHWQAVDDNATPDGDLTYISAATVGLTDTETYLPTGLPSGTIFGLQLSLYSRKTDSGARLIAPVIRLSGADHVGGNLAPSFPNYTYLITIYQVSPGTGVSWTIPEVNGVEAGVTITT